jgi:exopolysaccharide biosynthesis protein
MKAYQNRVFAALATITIAMTGIADRALSVPLQQEGNQIQLNGQPWNGSWIRRLEDGQQQIFVQEDWLDGALGLELLDSDRATEQRVKWFSVPFFADIAFDRPIQQRFLSIDQFGSQWRTEIAGSTLNIFTPDVSLQAIRRGKQEWGDRVVIDLSNRTPWQLQQQENTINMIIAAEALPSLLTDVDTKKGNLVEAVSIQSRNKQTILRIRTTEPAEAVVETLGDPNRIVVDIRRDRPTAEHNILWANGLRQQTQIVALPNPNVKSEQDPQTLDFTVTSLLVDLRQPSVSMRPIWSSPSGMFGTSTLKTMAQQWQAAAAINGGFFNRDRKLPVGPIKYNNQWMAGPVLQRGVVAWNDDGSILMDRLVFSEELTTSNQDTIKLSHLNSGYVQQGVARYTANWGESYTTLTDNEVLIVVTGDRVTSQYQATKAGENKVAIPRNGYLLVARKSAAVAAQLTAGTQLRGRTILNPTEFSSYAHLIGAGPLLLKNGKPVLDPNLEKFRPPFDTQGAARSAIATTGEPGEVILATIEASAAGKLPSLNQTAKILQQLGAVDALNLDGGGSTSLYLGGNVLNRPPERIAPIHNGIGVFIKPEQAQNEF